MSVFRRALTERRSMDWWAAGLDWRPGSGQVQYRAADAMCLSAVRGCVRLRASLIGQMPMGAYRDGPGGVAVSMSTQPPLVEMPSGVVSQGVWLHQWSASLDLWGNAFGAIVARDAAERPKQIEWLDPSKVTVVERTYSGRPEYRFLGQPFPAEDMFHMATFVLPGTSKGLAPLEHDGLVDLAKRAQEFGRRWFEDGGHPSAILAPDSDPGEEGARRLKAKWRGVTKRGGVAVLPQSVKYLPIQANAEQSKFLETVRGTQIDICMSFLTPPEMLGIATSGSSVTYANRDQRMSDVLVTAVNYQVRVLQDAITAALPRPQFMRINTGALLRSDLTTRYASYAVADQIGLLTLNEMRALEDRPPVEGGDVVRRPPTEPPQRSQ